MSNNTRASRQLLRYVPDTPGDGQQRRRALTLRACLLAALSQAPPATTATTTGAKKPVDKKRGAGNVRSLSDMREESDDEDDRPVETFIGGAKRCVPHVRHRC